MLTCAPPKGLRQWAQLYRLYQKSFPASEKKPFSIIYNMHRQGKSDVWRFEKDGHFAGLAVTINGGDVILLDYLAVPERCRGSGIGSGILRQLKTRYSGRGIFLEIESVKEAGENRNQRLRRKRFYEHCGLESMGVEALVFGVRMELMGIGCHLSFEEYRAFYRDHYSPWAAEHIRKAE